MITVFHDIYLLFSVRGKERLLLSLAWNSWVRLTHSDQVGNKSILIQSIYYIEYI